MRRRSRLMFCVVTLEWETPSGRKHGTVKMEYTAGPQATRKSAYDLLVQKAEDSLGISEDGPKAVLFFSLEPMELSR